MDALAAHGLRVWPHAEGSVGVRASRVVVVALTRAYCAHVGEGQHEVARRSLSGEACREEFYEAISSVTERGIIPVVLDPELLRGPWPGAVGRALGGNARVDCAHGLTAEAAAELVRLVHTGIALGTHVQHPRHPGRAPFVRRAASKLVHLLRGAAGARGAHMGARYKAPVWERVSSSSLSQSAEGGAVRRRHGNSSASLSSLSVHA